MGDDELRARVCDAALACVGRWGLTKTTLEDVAREAGCGRATIYRSFHGGKAEVMAEAMRREVARFRSEVDAAVAAVDPSDPTEVVSAAVVSAARFLTANRALGYLLAREPDVVLPWVSLHRIDFVYGLAAEVAGPHLRRFVADDAAAARAAELLVRVTLSYVLNPAPGCDLADPAQARHLLATYVIPGLARAERSTNPEEPCPAT
jgi:AcrR family transcriptional regulator